MGYINTGGDIIYTGGDILYTGGDIIIIQWTPANPDPSIAIAATSLFRTLQLEPITCFTVTVENCSLKCGHLDISYLFWTQLDLSAISIIRPDV